MADASVIYEFIVQRGRPCILSGPWQSFSAHPAFFRPEPSSEELWAALQTSFSLEDLINAHVAVDGESGPGLHPDLANGATIFAVRSEPDQPPSDLLAGEGLIGSTQLPFAAVLDSCAARSLMDHVGPRLFITFTSHDLLALWSTGLPAAPATGLDAIRGEDVDRFCDRLGLLRCLYPARWKSCSFAATQSTVQRRSTSLILVGWSPAMLSLEGHSQLDQVRQHLLRLQDHLGVPLNEISIWKPTAEGIARMRNCIELGTEADVHHALYDSAERDNELLVETPSQELPQNYGAAASYWLSLHRSAADPALGGPAWDRLQRLLEQELIQPLMRQADATADAVERSLIMALAEVSRLMHTQLALITSNYASTIRKAGGPANALLPPEQFQQSLILVNQFLSLGRELELCRRNQNSRVLRRP